MLIQKIDDWLFTPYPEEYDTRPAEVWTRKTTDIDLLHIERLLYEIKDDHWLHKNYTIEQIERLEYISLMKKQDQIVGFSGVQKINLGNRILTRLYQIPENRVKFTRELLRPTIRAMVEHQSLLVKDKAIITREPRQSRYFRRFVEALNKRSTIKWHIDNVLYETVPNSMQYVAWRKE